jgi:hypothetical protein
MPLRPEHFLLASIILVAVGARAQTGEAQSVATEENAKMPAEVGKVGYF